MAFVGLVGLYACNVRRLRSEKRNAANFVGFAPIFVDCFALAVAFRGLSCVCRLGCCLGCFAPVVCGFLLGCWLFFPSDDITKERAHRVGASSLRGLWACYAKQGFPFS